MPEQLIRVGAYYRMSDDKQEGSIARQQAAVRPYCERRGYAVVREYIDAGIPGDRLDRPDFRRLLADAQAGLFSRIVLDEPSRLSRSDPLTFLADVARPLRDAHVVVDSVSDGLQEWNDLANLILATVRADRSAGEVRAMSRRVLGECLRALGSGPMLAGTPPYGYVRREGRWETDPLRADAVRYAFGRYERGGITLEQLAFDLASRNYPPPERKGSPRKNPPAWSAGALKRILKNPQYTGARVWGWRSQGKYTRLAGGPGRADGGRPGEWNDPSSWFVRPGSHEALVTQEVFARVQSRLSDHHRGGRGAHNLGGYLLSGLCSCGHCGRLLSGVPLRGTRYYRCRPTDEAGRPVCGWRSVEEGELLERVVTTLEKTLLDEAIWEAALVKARKELEQAAAPDKALALHRRAQELEAQVAAGNRRLLQLPDDRLPGAVAALRELEGELAGLRRLEERLAQAGPVRDVEEDLAACRAWVGALTSAVSRRDKPEVAGALRGLLKTGVRRVCVNWRTEAYGKRNRYVPVGGFVDLHGCNPGTLTQLNVW